MGGQRPGGCRLALPVCFMTAPGCLSPTPFQAHLRHAGRGPAAAQAASTCGTRRGSASSAATAALQVPCTLSNSCCRVGFSSTLPVLVSRNTLSRNTGGASAPPCSPCSAPATSCRLRRTQEVRASSSAVSARCRKASHSCCTSSLSPAKRACRAASEAHSWEWASTMAARAAACSGGEGRAGRRCGWPPCIPPSTNQPAFGSSPPVPSQGPRPAHLQRGLALLKLGQAVEPLALHPQQQRVAKLGAGAPHAGARGLHRRHHRRRIAAAAQRIIVPKVHLVARRGPAEPVDARQHAAVQEPGPRGGSKREWTQ